MTDAAISVAANPTAIDFTLSSTGTYELTDARGSSFARDEINGVMALWAGNYANRNNTGNQIIYQGPNADGEEVSYRIITDMGNTNFLPIYIVQNVYERMDGNLDGSIIQQGNSADVDPPFTSVGMHGDNPNALPIFIIYEQIPR